VDKKEDSIIERGPQKVRGVGYFLIVVLLMVVVGVSVYLFAPKKKSFQLFPTETQSMQLACETKAGVTLFPRQNYDKKTLETVDSEISGEGSKLAIEIGDKTLKLLTDTSVGIGVAEPAEMVIVRQNSDSVEAVYAENGLIDAGIDTFVLNRKSGFAVWTKSKPSFFGNNAPDAQAYYLECH